MKKIFLLFVFIFPSLLLFAQKGKLKLAEEYFNSYQFITAAELYEEALDKDSTNQRIKERLAECYEKLNDSDKEEYYLSLICSNSSDSKNLKKYAQSLARNGKYDESLKWFKKYAELSPDNKVSEHIEYYSDISLFNKNSSLYRIKLVDFNSSQADFSPVFYKDGIVFCSTRNKGKKFKWDQSSFIDLFYKVEGSSVPVAFKKNINSSLHEGPATFTQNFDTIFFTRNDASSVGSSADKVLKLNIFYSILNNGEWGKAKKVEISNGQYSMGHPAISPDHKLYFVSDMPGGNGGTDIYYTKWENGEWIAPVNLGPQINTSDNELFPFIDEKGSLYFSSKGHPGLGGLDVFHSTYNGTAFTAPQNLGSPVNSSKDDFGYIIKETKGYFSSNRGNNHKDDNIYSVLFDKSKVITVQAISKAKTPIPNFVVEVNNTSAPSSSSGARTAEIVFAQIFNLDDNYTIKISKEGFRDYKYELPSSKLVSISSSDTIKVELEETIVNKTIFIDLISLSKEKLTGGNVELKNTKTGKIEKINVTREASPSFILQQGESYEITGLKKDFKTKTMVITSAALDTLPDHYSFQLILPPVNTLFEENKIGQLIEMDIKYDRGKFNIRPDAAKELNRLVEHLRKYPNLKVELGSHTDNRGSEEENFKLSQKRAESAVNYLIGKGISTSRLMPIGYGENDLKVQEAITEEDHQQNRRTTVKIVAN